MAVEAVEAPIVVLLIEPPVTVMLGVVKAAMLLTFALMVVPEAVTKPK